MLRRFGAFVLFIAMISACSGQSPSGSVGDPVKGNDPASVGTPVKANVPAPGQRITLKVAYVPVLAFAPLYRAVSKGYFSPAGIDIDLTVVQSASDVVAFLG